MSALNLVAITIAIRMTSVGSDARERLVSKVVVAEISRMKYQVAHITPT